MPLVSTLQLVCYKKFAIIFGISCLVFIKPHDIYNDLAGLKRQFHLLFMGEFGQFEPHSRCQPVLTNQFTIIMDIKTEREETDSRDTKDKVEFNELKILLLDIVLPLLDILVDIAKALVLVFEGQQIGNYQRFSDHFLHTAVYGVISVMLKWCPAVVAAFHFQDMNRCRCPQRLRGSM